VNVLDDEIVQDEQIRTTFRNSLSRFTVRVNARVVNATRRAHPGLEDLHASSGGGIQRSITAGRIASGVGVERSLQGEQPSHRQIEGRPSRQARLAQRTSCASASAKAATLRERRVSS